MNWNITTYIIYLPLISFIMFRIGWLFYKNGEVFLASLIERKDLVVSINKLLLAAYYLVNIGYAIVTISWWGKVSNVVDMVNSISITLGKIILFLALLHYNNVFVLKQLSKSKLIHT